MDKFRNQATEILVRLSADSRYATDKELFEDIINADQSTQVGIEPSATE